MTDIPQPADYISIGGTAYRYTHVTRNGRHHPIYLRHSAPLDAVPGKKSKHKVSYPVDRVPTHEPITKEQADEIQAVGHEAFMVRLRATAQPS